MSDLPKEVLDLIDDLRREIETLKAENRDLRRRLAEVERGQKRQAAPFSKGTPKPHPKTPGRKPGAAYGLPAHRPRPVQIDREVEVPLPRHCPDCGGAVDDEAVREQFQTELPPVRPEVTRFRVHVGSCRRCGRRVQGRHEEQVSDALGAANNQIGPRTLAIAAQLNKVYGLTYGKIAGVFDELFDLTIAPSTIVRGLERVAFRAEPVYHDLTRSIRTASVVYPDETGWKVEALLAWLWVFVTKDTAVYAIRASRGADVVEEFLGRQFSGTVGHDGWAPYDQFEQADHQTCFAHLLRRCHELLESALRGAARFPRAVRSLLKDALALRDRRDAGLVTARGLAIARGKLEARCDDLLSWSPSYPPNRRLAKHLRAHRDQLFTFLKQPGIEATNWMAEQAIRPAVVNRKVFGGNRTWTGAAVQSVLTTLFRTCSIRKIDPIPFLVDLLHQQPGLPPPQLAPAPS